MTTFAKTDFKNISESTNEDWKLIYKSYVPVVEALPSRILLMLEGLGKIQGALPISRLDHSLQAATRAFKDNRSDEYIFTVLMHDIGSYCSIHSHADVSAAILKDHVSAELHWMVVHHEIFQLHHFYKQLGQTENQRDKYADHPYFGLTEEFCRLYDAPSWDKGYKHLMLKDFDDLLRQQLSLK